MGLIDHVAMNDLGDVIDAAEVQDCLLEVRKKRGTGDVWVVARGPLATTAIPLLSAAGLENARQLQEHDTLIGVSSRQRYAHWPRLRTDDHALIAFRARGDDLEFVFLLGDGRPFGGGGSWLPTARRASLRERAQIWLSGRRGSRVEIARHTGTDDS